MNKPDKQMPEIIYAWPNNGVKTLGFWCDDPYTSSPSDKYISESKHLSEIAALEQNPIHKALMDAEKTTEVKYRNMPELKLLPTEEDLVRKDMIIEQLQNKLDNLADELDKFLASKGSALSTRAIASAWIRGQYDND